MSHADLPLFAWPPSCQVIAFPLANRIGKVRRTAQLLASKRGEEAALYWKQVLAANRKHLMRVGMSAPAIEVEQLAFREAVQAEIVRQAFGVGRGSSHDPRGAA